MPGRLSGKVCVVTGTGGSMGRATALTFAAAGASVVGCDVAVEPAEETVGLVQGADGQMVSLQPCHLDHPGDCAKLVDLAIERSNKTGIMGMTRQLAMEGGEHGIRVNSISPGLIQSGATRGDLEDGEFGRDMRDRTLLGRLGRPEDVANVALFLASDDSAYVTGIDLVVDGGMKVW
jgi:NAD(P)-dependent dehydrogenase (short-subunit alcohol dehydrogenase family)